MKKIIIGFLALSSLPSFVFACKERESFPVNIQNAAPASINNETGLFFIDGGLFPKGKPLPVDPRIKFFTQAEFKKNYQ